MWVDECFTEFIKHILFLWRCVNYKPWENYEQTLWLINYFHYLNPLNADNRLWNFLHSQWEEKSDSDFYCAVERHSDKHSAGSNGVAKERVEGKGKEDNDLAASKEGGQVESTQIRALQYLMNFFPGKIGRMKR